MPLLPALGGCDSRLVAVESYRRYEARYTLPTTLVIT
jgi:hypothetical protein